LGRNMCVKHILIIEIELYNVAKILYKLNKL
jgi:hypothetical protein